MTQLPEEFGERKYSMITKEQWFKHASFQADLKALLDNPVMQTALGICRDQILYPTPLNRTDIVEWMAVCGSKKEGYNEFYINLLDLARPEKPSVPAQKAWEYETQPEGNTTNA